MQVENSNSLIDENLELILVSHYNYSISKREFPFKL
jgi:hypothetical protein